MHTEEMDFLEGKLGAASLVQCRAVGGEHVAILVGFVLFLVFCFFFKYIFFFQWRLPPTYLESLYILDEIILKVWLI